MQRITDFSIDRTEVTIEQYAKFVSETGYVTAPKKQVALGFRIRPGTKTAAVLSLAANPASPLSI